MHVCIVIRFVNILVYTNGGGGGGIEVVDISGHFIDVFFDISIF